MAKLARTREAKAPRQGVRLHPVDVEDGKTFIGARHMRLGRRKDKRDPRDKIARLPALPPVAEVVLPDFKYWADSTWRGDQGAFPHCVAFSTTRVTVTDLAEAAAARDAGVDALVLQGSEAGGHRAAWEDRDEGGEVGVLTLLRLVATETDLPLVAAGGIPDGAVVAAVLVAGAAARPNLGRRFCSLPKPAHTPPTASRSPPRHQRR